jgi:hypothetical protein
LQTKLGFSVEWVAAYTTNYTCHASGLYGFIAVLRVRGRGKRTEHKWHASGKNMEVCIKTGFDDKAHQRRLVCVATYPEPATVLDVLGEPALRPHIRLVTTAESATYTKYQYYCSANKVFRDRCKLERLAGRKLMLVHTLRQGAAARLEQTANPRLPDLLYFCLSARLATTPDG